ncbi:type II secretion system protein N [Cellvibrio zantedeschiae]|nr:type II secretion system protein N [Cellvibrio zantedeschiae]
MVFKAVSLPKLNMSKKFWITLGVIFWLYFVVSNLPAVWGAYLLTRSGDIAMNGVSGTLWSGRASLASIKVKGVDHSLGQLTWKLNLLSFLTLKPCALIGTHMDNQEFDGVVCMRGKNGITVKDASVSFPAALVQPLLPLAISGQFALTIERLEIGELQLLGLRAKATWMDSKIYNGSNWMNLGGIGAELTDDGKKGLNAHIFDVNSPLHVDLLGNLPYPTGAAIKGSFSLPEPYFREINAGAWVSMFATQQPNDAQGNLTYAVDLNF